MVPVRGVGVVVLAVVAFLVLAGPAAAHTELESSIPADGSTIEAGPTSITIDFTEDIEVELTHVWLQDAAGVMELSPVVALDGRSDAITVPLARIGDGTYTVTFHVVSADATPIAGTFAFTVDSTLAATTTSGTIDPAADLPPDESGAVPVDDTGRPITIPELGDHSHTPEGVTGTLARGLLDASLSTLIGGLAFVAAVWPAAARLARTRLVLWAAAVLATLASFELAAFQHAAATGLSTIEALSPWHQWDALQFRFGRIAAARIVLLGIAAYLTARLVKGGAPTARSAKWCLAVTAMALGLVETLVLLSHTSTPGLVDTVARVLHVLGVSVWLGGLVMLCCVVLPRRRTDELLAVLPRFSTMATGAVGVLTVGGLVLAIDLVGGIGDLPTTGYGRALLAKVVVVGGLLFAASVSRQHVRDGLVAGDRRLVLWVGTELGLMAAVFGLTAFLVTQAPPS